MHPENRPEKGKICQRFLEYLFVIALSRSLVIRTFITSLSKVFNSMSKLLFSVVLNFLIISTLSGCASDKSRSQQNNQNSASKPLTTTDPIASILNDAGKNPHYNGLPSVEEMRSSPEHMACFVAAQSIGAGKLSYCKTNGEVAVCQWIYQSMEDRGLLLHQLVDEDCDKKSTTTALFCAEAVSRFSSTKI